MTTITHGLAAGDVLISSWGYEQTNVDFYEVTRATAKMVAVRPIAADKTPGEHWGTYTATPERGAYRGEEFRCKVKGTPESPWIALDSFSIATKWDGNAALGSSYA